MTNRILNVTPSLNTEKDWNFGHAIEAKLTANSIPKSIDLRQPWWDIGDQGDSGACTGWAVADGLLRYHLVKRNRIAPNDKLSPRFIWMAAKETDEFQTAPTSFIEFEGSSLKAALDVARKFGCVKDNILPFTTQALYQGSATAFYALAAQLKITGYFNLGRNLDTWRKWLANNGPIMVRLNVDRSFDNAMTVKGKVVNYLPGTAHGAHAATLVGYTPDYFILRNSWGLRWGDQGFGYIYNTYAATNLVEAYGITVA